MAALSSDGEAIAERAAGADRRALCTARARDRRDGRISLLLRLALLRGHALRFRARSALACRAHADPVIVLADRRHQRGARASATAAGGAVAAPHRDYRPRGGSREPGTLRRVPAIVHLVRRPARDR